MNLKQQHKLAYCTVHNLLQLWDTGKKYLQPCLLPVLYTGHHSVVNSYNPQSSGPLEIRFGCLYYILQHLRIQGLN